jgi:hypothetical protein
MEKTRTLDFSFADHGTHSMLGAAQMCGIVPPRRDLSNHPVYRAPAFLVLKLEDGMWKGVFTDFNLKQSGSNTRSSRSGEPNG